MPTEFDPSLMIETEGDGRLAPFCARAQVEALARAAVAKGHLVVHLHGGLVGSARGREGAAALAPVYRDAQALPVAFVWHTGPLEIVRGNLKEILDEALFKKLLRVVVRWAAGRLFAGAGAKGTSGFDLPSDLDVEDELARTDRPAFADLTGQTDALTDADLALFEEAVRRDADLAEAAAQVVASDAGAKGLTTYAGPRVPTHLDPAVLAELGGPEGRGVLELAALAKHAGAVLVRVVRRFATGRDHGLHATCVEEIAREFYLAAAGGALWSMIKKEAADTFLPGERGGRVFVDALAEAARAAGKAPRITVVGHSAGSIYGSHLVVELAKKGLVVDDLVFLAAAVRYDLFGALMAEADAALGAPAVRRAHFIALGEDCESGYWEVPGLYSRSLLYMVSGAAERDAAGESVADEPLVGMQRFWDRPELVDAKVRRILADATTRVWLGRRADEKVHRHGGLTDPAEAPMAIELLAAVVASQ